MTGAIARAARRLVWEWERRRPYPIREAVCGFPPVPCAEGAAMRIAVLCTPDTVADGLWGAYSLLAHAPEPCGLCLVLDGDAAGVAARVRALFPGAAVLDARKVVGRLPEGNVRRFAGEHPLGRKLGVILALCRESGLIYADADVLAFGPLRELSGSPERPLYLQDIAGVQRDAGAAARLAELGLGYTETLNTGFLRVPAGGLDLDLAERILDYDTRAGGWFVETTVLAALLHAAGGEPLPKERYVVSVRRQFAGEADHDYGALALRHFVTPVRHLMYGRGMPFLRDKWRPRGYRG